MRHGKFILAAIWAMALGVPLALAGDSNLTGTWNLTITSPQGTRTPSMLLTQDGEIISGTYKGTRAEAPLTGTCKGNQFHLKTKLVNREGQVLLLEYTGVASDGNMQGTVAMGQMGKASFTGKKAP